MIRKKQMRQMRIRQLRRKISKKGVKLELWELLPPELIPLFQKELTLHAGDYACGRKEFVLNEMRRRMRDMKRREGRA